VSPGGAQTETVAITGVGLHSAFGGLMETQAALHERRNGLGPISLPNIDGFPPVAGAPAADYDLLPYLPDRKLRKYMNPTVELAVLTAGRALDSAGLRADDERRPACALFVSTGLIAFDLAQLTPLHAQGTSADGQLDLARMGSHGIRACHPLLPFKMLLNMPLGLVSIVFGLRGENFILYPGAGQAGTCLEKAWRGIRTGRFARALVGGSDQQISLLPLVSLKRQGRLAQTPAAAEPGDAHQGRAPADAGAFLLLEAESAAHERGARILASLDSIQLSAEPGELHPPAEHEHAPDRFLCTGSLSAEQDSQDRTRFGIMPENLDGVLGHAGAAALPTLAALACAGPAGSCLLVSRDPDDQAVGVHLTSTGQEDAL
jgi:3-oxoacyl-[acyl-carrier-protein] synthase II